MSLLVGMVLAAALGAYANPRPILSLPAGGLQPRLERSVLLEKERLRIGKQTVQVEYEFRNTGSEAVSTEVEFPLPALHSDWGWRGEGLFSNFRAWEGDREIALTKEVRAFARGEDVTDALLKIGLTPERFKASEGAQAALKHLDEATKAGLARVGLLVRNSADDTRLVPQFREGPSTYRVDEDYCLVCNWECRISYRWPQVFPPGEAVRLRHRYSPVVGESGSDSVMFAEQFKDACAGPDLKAFMDGHQGENMVRVTWLEYLVTTANAWQTPIRDFELVVEKKPDEKVTFCWDGKIEEISQTEIRARKNDFVPDRELKIYFLERLKR
jgi:hypothetical protein